MPAGINHELIKAKLGHAPITVTQTSPFHHDH